jgi:hypothetical protein
MEKLNILRGKMFWFIVCFALSALFFVLQYPIIGGVFMVYPVVIVLISMVYGFIINPYKEHQITKTIRNADGFIGGFVRDENGNAIQGVRIGIYDPNHQSNIYLSQCYGLTDNIGHYWVSNIIDGEWEVIYSVKGYKEYSVLKKFGEPGNFIEKIVLEEL